MVRLSRDTGKATAAGTLAFIREFAKVYRHESRGQKVARRTKQGQQVDRRAFEAGLKKAAGAFAATFISTLLGLGLDKVMKEAGYGKVKEAIAKRIIQSFAGGMPEVFIKAISSAWAAEAQHPGSFGSALEKELLTELKAHFSSMVTADFKQIGEALAG